MILLSLNAKKELCEKSGSNNDRSKLKFLEVEILKLRNEPHSYQNTLTRNDWKLVKLNRPFSHHNTENRNIITSNLFLTVKGMTSSCNENPDFVVTLSTQTNILISNLDPISCQLKIIIKTEYLYHR